MKKRIAALLVLVGLAVWAAQAGSPPRRLAHDLRNKQCWERPHDGGVVALGDSLTRMNSDPAWDFLGSESWFALGVCEKKIKYGYNAGVYGDTTAGMLRRFRSDVADHHPAQVVILGGTNDLLGGVPQAVTVQNLAELVSRAQALHATVTLGLVPRPQTVPAARVDALNAAIRALAARDRVRLVDFAAAVTSTIDGVHPTHASSEAMLRAYLS